MQVLDATATLIAKIVSMREAGRQGRQKVRSKNNVMPIATRLAENIEALDTLSAKRHYIALGVGLG